MRIAVNGRKLREIRLGKGILAKDLAEKSDTSERTIIDIEEGKRRASEETLIAVCRVLEIEPAVLLADEPEPAPAKGGGDAAKDEA